MQNAFEVACPLEWESKLHMWISGESTPLTLSISSARLFFVMDGIFCLFQGHIENVPHLKQRHRLNKTAHKVIIVIEAYRTLRDRGPYPANQVVRNLHGQFIYSLRRLFKNHFYSRCKTQDADESVPFFWGNDSEGHLVLVDDAETVKKDLPHTFFTSSVTT
ncbi:hypothetical protein HYC85_003796 [Camellia sinensis]|uniref:DUF3700 domain-containing protein n=1 Tax=Camellia sinensis TaxID=4442 RepID=A0A7J7HWE8_CAMSI|nr:hypothetical protein HYC85_003796 [Camellia sinensis]